MGAPGSPGPGAPPPLSGGNPPGYPPPYPPGPPGQYPGAMYPPPPPPPAKGTATWLIAAIGCLIAIPVVVAVIGILAAIAIPDFLKFQAKAKQTEAKLSLIALHTAQESYRLEHQEYAGSGGPKTCFELLNWKPPADARYTYYCGQDELAPSGPGPFCPQGENLSVIGKDSFTIMAVGNIDRDATCDIWTINDAKELRNVTNDVMD